MILNSLSQLQMDYFTFKLIYKGTEGSQKKFGLKISSWVLSLFADELDVRYDLKEACPFKGLTNIPNDKGDNEVLAIPFACDVKPLISDRFNPVRNPPLSKKMRKSFL